MTLKQGCYVCIESAAGLGVPLRPQNLKQGHHVHIDNAASPSVLLCPQVVRQLCWRALCSCPRPAGVPRLVAEHSRVLLCDQHVV